ncbi:MAG TPA: T9SS type A sorting domain-containing protein [Bacteroidia bacterium]|nr:T9SS type A sorting domain-containing protein [Bacteroidia bacterium]
MHQKVKLLFLVATLCFAGFKAVGQSFCFYNPNTGPHYHNSSLAIYDITTGDFNADGHLDVVTANSTASNISFVPGYGNGTLGNPDTFLVTSILFCITSGDFNGDGHLDVAAAGSLNVYVLMGNGNGTFQPYITYSSGTNPSRIYYIDANNDNIPDLVAACGNGVFILPGQVSGIFLPAVQYPTGGSVVDVTIADFDNDSIRDITATTQISWTVSVLSYLKGNPNGIFSAAVSIPVPDHSIFGINSEDLNADGAVDLIVSNQNNLNHRMEIYFGNGNGTFTAPVFFPAFYNPTYIYLADMDNDLVKDIVVVETGGFTVLKNNANGTLNAYEHFTSMPVPNGLAIGDYDEDGKADIIVPSGYSGLIGMNLNCNVTGIEEAASPMSVNLFPNPFHSSATIIIEKNFLNATFVIYDPTGQEVMKLKSITAQKIILNRNNLPAGIYFYKLAAENKFITAGKFIVY